MRVRNSEFGIRNFRPAFPGDCEGVDGDFSCTTRQPSGRVRFGVVVGGGAEGNSEFRIPNSSFATRQPSVRVRFGVVAGGGVEGNSEFRIPNSEFTTRQSRTRAWRQAP